MQFVTAMPLRLLSAFFMMAACFNPENRTESFSADTKSSFERKLEKMKTAEVDTLYARICRRLEDERKELRKKWDNAGTDAEKTAITAEARTLLLDRLSDSLFVCWYGTGWDFNGTSTCPRSGTIACGYFVTTLLRQSGFVINRTFLAQQASSVLIHTFSPNDKIKTITNNQVKKVFDYMKTQADGIYLLGLDNHTGFIVKKNGKTNFVHANYLSSVDQVVCEPLESSTIIQKNNFFMIGDLLHSDTTIRKWIRGEKIE